MSERWSGQGGAFAVGLLAGSIATLLLASRKSDDKSGDTHHQPPSQPHNGQSNTTNHLPSEIRSEMLSRNSLYFSSPTDAPGTNHGMERITNSIVLIVGLGGVGSHTAHMLARSGVQYLRLVDFDQVTLSSLNRHAVATLKDVGLPKATVLCQHLREICPDESKLILDPIIKMYTGDKEKDGGMLDPPPGKQWDCVIDAIDDVPTKANLIAYCAKRNIRVISCMGAGGKADPTRVHISDLRSASRDPLATAVRQKLRLMGKMEAKKMACVYSSEKVVAKLAQITPEQKEEGMQNFGAMDNMRVRVLPVVGTMPAIMGQTLAAMALCELGNKAFTPQREKNLEDKLMPTLKNGDENITTNGVYIGPILIDPDDVEYLMVELWRNRCGVTGDRLGTSLELYRWDRTRPATPNNLVLMSMKAAQKFEKDFEALGDGRKGLDVDVVKRVEARLSTCILDAEE
ncbi:hypothetical protein THAPSDRAFT_262699 [Thalassiosira pseudonana CCMP1335]